MSRIWDVDGIEWEDLPTVSDLLCAADNKILAREVALRYAGKAGGCGCGDSEHGLKRARRKLKKLRKIDPEPSDKIVLLPKHVINRRGAGRGFGYYDVEACVFTRAGVQGLGKDLLDSVRPWELILMDDESASEMLGYRVWLGGEWDLCERYRFLAVVCARVLNSIWAQKELRKCLEEGDAACDMDEDEAIEGVRRDVLYPEEVIDAKLGGYWDVSLGLDLPWKDEHRQTYTRIDRAIDDLFAEETKRCAAELGKKLERGYEKRGEVPLCQLFPDE
ncbi:hypothetical protein [Collinsella sp. AM18-10]|uniref:hypothetical protein n=1 Tax=Collinsella sp. AM18-10 TaxID=2292028 RepID=UPI000E4B75F3|nr:hypothetical protein [Collinsella sp. AM18-10]RHH34325.1 hypothetical protein DW211_06425 [Collinsella sp. AM18-10]